MTAVVTAAIALLASTGAWSLTLATGSHGHSDIAIVLMATSLWVATVTSLTGMLVARSRWARRLGLAVTVGHAAIALIVALDPLWWVAAILSVVAAISVAGPWLNGFIRSLPAAAGPPPRAILVPLMLVATPFLIGLADADGVMAAVVGGGALVAAFWFIRTLPLALTVVRVGWPVLAIAGAWFMGLPAGFVAAAMAVVVSGLGWDSSITRAVVPLIERGSLVPIPPELTPRDVLDAANLDERGRRR